MHANLFDSTKEHEDKTGLKTANKHFWFSSSKFFPQLPKITSLDPDSGDGNKFLLV